MRTTRMSVAVWAAVMLVVFLAFAAGGTAFGATSTTTKIKQRGKLRVGIAIAPPYLMQDLNTGKYFGPNALIAERIAAKLGVGVEYVESDWGLMIAGLQADKFDIVSTAFNVTPERLKVVDFVVFGKIGFCYIVLKSNTKINTTADMNNPNVRIGVPAATGGEELVRGKYTRATIKSALLAPGQYEFLQDVLAKRIDASTLDSPLAPAYEKQFPQIKIVPGGGQGCAKSPDLPIDIGIPVKKTDKEFKAFLEAVIKGMRKDIEASLLKYSTPEYLKLPK